MRGTKYPSRACLHRDEEGGMTMTLGFFATIVLVVVVITVAGKVKEHGKRLAKLEESSRK